MFLGQERGGPGRRSLGCLNGRLVHAFNLSAVAIGLYRTALAPASNDAAKVVSGSPSVRLEYRRCILFVRSTASARAEDCRPSR